jgi:hypothetical protein
MHWLDVWNMSEMFSEWFVVRDAMEAGHWVELDDVGAFWIQPYISGCQSCYRCR